MLAGAFSRKVSSSDSISAESEGSSLRKAAVAALAGSLVLLASFVNFLGHNEYPLLRPEVGILIVILIALGMVMGLIYAIGGKYTRVLLEVLLVFLAFDLNFEGIIFVFWGVLTVVLLNRHVVPFMGIVASVVLVTGIFGIAFSGGEIGGEEEAFTSLAKAPMDRPALLHIILDEHIGVEGLLGDEPEVATMREQLKSFYIGNGFRLFGGAYSEYLHTVNAIPQILNFGVEQEWKSEVPHGMLIDEGKYFEYLKSVGYKPIVFQTDYLRYCSEDRDYVCRQYRKQDIAPFNESNLSTYDKVKLIAYNFIALSDVIEKISLFYDLETLSWAQYGVTLPQIDLEARRRVDPVAALNMFEHLIRALRSAQPGDAYFAHLLIPHDPYSVRADCSLKKLNEWRSPWSLSESPRKEIRSGYFDQVGCVNIQLTRAFEALRKSKAGKNFVLIIHGDHGYRDYHPQPAVKNIGRFREDDLVRGHSALFAVYASGIAAGYDDRRIPIAMLLKAFAQSEFRSIDVELPHDFTHSIVLENSDSDWRPSLRYPLPQWWVDP